MRSTVLRPISTADIDSTEPKPVEEQTVAHRLPKLIRTGNSSRYVVDPIPKQDFQGQRGVTGKYYRFFLSPDNIARKKSKRGLSTVRGDQVMKHLDVFCDWDKGEAVLDTDELANGMRYSRRTYSYALFMYVAFPARAWEEIQKNFKVDIQEFCDWITGLIPRSIHDFKPLLVLMKAALSAMGKNQLGFFLKAADELQRLLNLERTRVAELELEMAKVQDEMDEKLRRMMLEFQAGNMAMMGSAEMAEAERRRQHEDHRAERVWMQIREGLEGSLRNSLFQLHSAQEGYRVVNQQLSAKEDAMNELLEQHREALRKLHKSEMRAGLAAKVEELESKLQEKNQEIIEKDNRIRELESKLEQRQEQDVALMPWATYRHIVECKWAAALTVGESTISVPPATKIVLAEKEQNEGHVVNVPGATTLITPASNDGTAKMTALTIPSHSILTFPMGTDGDVILPGGSSVVLPLDGELEFTINIPPSARVVPPRDTHPRLAATQAVYFAPPGPPSLAKCTKGSIIITPKEGRARLRIPSRSEVVFRIGQKRHIELHANTSIAGYTKSIYQSHEDANKEFYLVLPPQAEVTLPPLGGPYRITVPSGASVSSPEGAPATADLGPGCTFSPSTGLPCDLAVPAGGTIVMPPPLDSSAEAIAMRMQLHGTECSATALGGMDFNLSAAVLSTKMLDARRVAKILHSTREQTAFQVLKRLDPNLRRTVVDLMSPSMVGSIMSQGRIQDCTDILEQAGVRPSKALQIQGHAHSFNGVKTLMTNDEFRPWKTTSDLGGLDTVAAARLLSTSSSSRSAAVLSNMSSSNFAKAVDHMEALYDIAGKMQVLGYSYKAADIKTHRMLQELARANTERSMFDLCTELFKHFHSAYGICLTLSSRSSPVQEDGEEEEQEDPERNAAFFTEAEADLESEEASEDYNSAMAQEELADERLDVMLSTEDIKFGTQVGMSTCMKAGELLKMQDAAAERGALMISGTVMIIPIHNIAGKQCVAFLSHVMLRTACDHLLGGFPRPRDITVPKAIEIMTLTAKALCFAFDEVARNPVQVPTDTYDTTDMDRIKGILDGLKREKKKGLQYLLSKKKFTSQCLREMKGYDKPPVILVKVFTALFVILEIGSYEDYLGPDLASFPADPYLVAPKYERSKMNLWKLVRHNIQLSERHPDHLLKKLNQESKEDVFMYCEDKQMRTRAAKRIMRDLEQKEVVRASAVGGRLCEWVEMSVKQ
eukprot:gene6364-7626_t